MVTTQDFFENFVGGLSAAADNLEASRVSNIYDSSGVGRARARNVVKYLTAMQSFRPTVALVGEAPGYRGSVRTGVPFGSEQVLATTDSGFRLFFGDDFELPMLEHTPSTEVTASVMWRALSGYERPPLLWAAFPMHPHLDNNPASNRTPSPLEVRCFSNSLQNLLDFYGIRSVIAVGVIASKQLNTMNIPHVRVRHPARGGGPQFTEQVHSALPP